MREFLGPLLCTLLAVPDNPEAGVLELPKLALAAAAQYGWDPRLPARCGALLDGVRLLAAMARDQYPYCYQVHSRARGSLRALIHPALRRARLAMTCCTGTRRRWCRSWRPRRGSWWRGWWRAWAS